MYGYDDNMPPPFEGTDFPSYDGGDFYGDDDYRRLRMPPNFPQRRP